jgi:hypothetical protein
VEGFATHTFVLKVAWERSSAEWQQRHSPPSLKRKAARNHRDRQLYWQAFRRCTARYAISRDADLLEGYASAMCVVQAFVQAYDCVDPNVAMLERMYEWRLRGYPILGYTVE